MRIVLDTNVLVSGLLNPRGAPGRVLDLVLGGELQLAVDDRIIAEYRAVLRRQKFAFAPADVDLVLDFIEAESLHVPAVPASVRLPDPGDQPFLEVAASCDAAALVTGNARDFGPPDLRRRHRVQSSAEFVERWRKPGSFARPRDRPSE